MIVMTLEEARSQLVTVNAAINSLLSGKTLTQLRIGSGTFQRTYTYQEISLDSLLALRAELMKKIADLETPVTGLDWFGRSMTIPLIVCKDRW